MARPRKVRKSLAKNAVNDARYGRALRLAKMAWSGPEFIEDEDGFRIRVWGDPNEDWTKDSDVRAWLVGKRAIEDLREGLEFVRESYVQSMIKQGFLKKDGPLYWITAKAAARFDLPRVMGRAFPV